MQHTRENLPTCITMQGQRKNPNNNTNGNDKTEKLRKNAQVIVILKY
jgi:hypothetical protein